MQYDNSTKNANSSNSTSSNSTSASDVGDPAELYYCDEYNFYYDSDGVIHGGQSDGADAYETYMAYKTGQQRAEETGSTDLE